MRVTTALCRLLRLEGMRVTSVVFEADRVLVGVALRRRRLVDPCNRSERCEDAVVRERVGEVGAGVLPRRAGAKRSRRSHSTPTQSSKPSSARPLCCAARQ